MARERHFDLVGFMALAVMAALGGGMIRDVLLQMGPPVALTNPYYLAGAVTGALIAFLLRFDGKWSKRSLIVADGFVLGAWTATGTLKALEGGFDILPSILMGVITAVGGGMVRDVAVGQVPSIFGGNTLYATPSLIATIPAIVLWELGRPSLATLASTVVGGILCVLARALRWSLPVNNDYSLQKSYMRLRVSLAQYARAYENSKRSRKSPAHPDIAADQDAAMREIKKEQNLKNTGLLARSRRAKRDRNQAG